MTTGMVMPRISLVRSLNCVTNAPILTPCCPRAGPTGGAGVACPPGPCKRTSPVELGPGMPPGAPGQALATEHVLGFPVGHRRRGMVPSPAHEVPHAGSFPKEIEDAVVELRLRHQVPGEQLAFARHPLAVAHL